MVPRPARILVPLDFSETSAAAVEYAAFLAKTFGSRLELLHVIDPLLHVSGEALFVGSERVETVAEFSLRVAGEEMEKIEARLVKDGIDVRLTIEHGVPWERIVAAAGRVDLLVMGTHGRTGISRVFLGSVTDKVVQRSAVPVLTVRGAAAETAGATVAVPIRTVAEGAG